MSCYKHVIQSSTSLCTQTYSPDSAQKYSPLNKNNNNNNNNNLYLPSAVFIAQRLVGPSN